MNRLRTAVLPASALLLLAACADTAEPDAPYRPDVRTSTISASVVREYPRSTPRTPLGDPATLDLCAIAVPDPDAAGLTAPAVADAGGCTFATRAGGSAAPIAVSVQPQLPGGVNGAPAIVRPPSATAPGAQVFAPNYDTTTATCRTAVRIYRLGATTAAVQVVAGPAVSGDSSATCAAATRVRNRFVIATASATAISKLSRLATATPSVLAIDTCRLAAAGRVGAVIDTSVDTTGTPVVGAFAAACRFPTAAGTVELLPGALRSGARLPGASRIVQNRQLTLLPADAPRCAVATPVGRSGTRQVLTARFTGTGTSVAADCNLAATALVAYLKVLDGP